MLKLPGGQSGIARVAVAEAAALTVWEPTRSAARLVDFNSDALMLVRFRPRTHMRWATEESLDGTVTMNVFCARVPAVLWATLANLFDHLHEQVRRLLAMERVEVSEQLLLAALQLQLPGLKDRQRGLP